ncbi:hypothetical protein VYU27_003320 [Nannochloropsis oceanica]
MVAKPKRRGLKPQGKLKSEKQWDASNPRKRRKKKGAHSYQDYRKAWWDGEMERRAVRDKVTAAAAVAWGDDNGPVPIPLDAAGAKLFFILVVLPLRDLCQVDVPAAALLSLRNKQGPATTIGKRATTGAVNPAKRKANMLAVVSKVLWRTKEGLAVNRSCIASQHGIPVSFLLAFDRRGEAPGKPAITFPPLPEADDLDVFLLQPLDPPPGGALSFQVAGRGSLFPKSFLFHSTDVSSMGCRGVFVKSVVEALRSMVQSTYPDSNVGSELNSLPGWWKGVEGKGGMVAWSGSLWVIHENWEELNQQTVSNGKRHALVDTEAGGSTRQQRRLADCFVGRWHESKVAGTEGLLLIKVIIDLTKESINQ